MAAKRNVPKLRFPGFTDDWEQRKVSDVSDRYDNLRIPVAANLRVKGSTPYYGANGIQDYVEGYTHDGEFILVAEDGANDLKNYPVNYVNGRVWVNNHAHVLQAKGNIADNRFIGYAISRADIESVLVGGGRAKLNAEVLMDISLQMPSLKEQIQISSFVSSIENLITLHQCKLNAVKQYKAGMLQKMFPRDGEKVPEVRFPEFHADWQKVTLGELYTERNERGDETLPILSVSIHTGVSGGELDAEELGKNVRRSEDKSLYKRVYSGDLVFNMMRAWQGAIGVVKTEGMVSPAYISAVPKENVYPPFMDYLLRRTEVIKQINNLSYGVTDFRKRLYWDSFVQVTVCLPSFEEQKAITEFFLKTDALLSVNQKKVDQMKQYKQGLLRQMFV